MQNYGQSMYPLSLRETLERPLSIFEMEYSLYFTPNKLCDRRSNRKSQNPGNMTYSYPDPPYIVKRNDIQMFLLDGKKDIATKVNVLSKQNTIYC